MFDITKNHFLIHEEINRYLDNILKTKTFANGYIFYGAEGLGKKETAFKFIKSIFTQYSTSRNIEEKIIHNNHPDLLIIEPTSNNKGKSTKNYASEIPKKNNSEIIKIDQIRNIKTFIGQKSIESEKKIIIIHKAHLLHQAAANCRLISFEEPSNGIFIL